MRKKLSEKLFVIGQFISQSYSFPFKKPFAKTVLVEFAKGYLEAHGGLWWKDRHPPIKTGKKLSEKLLWFLWIHLTEFHLSRPEAVRYDCFLEFAEGYLEPHRGLWWNRKYPQMKSVKELSEKLLCGVWLPLNESQLYFMQLFASLISVESENWYFGSLWIL